MRWTAGEGRGLRPLLELLGLTGLAVAQPVLQVFANGAGIFVLGDAGPVELVLLALAIAVVPTLVLRAAELVAGALNRRAGGVLHVVFVAGLGGLLVLQVLKKSTELGTGPLVASGAVATVVVGGVYLLVGSVRLWLQYLAAAPVAFVALFLFASPATPLVMGGSGEDGTIVRAKAENPVPVVVVVLDELPTTSLLDGTGGIDADLFPNIAAMAGTSTWYRNHTAVASDTETALPALLTGRYPGDGQPVASVSEFPENLFTLLDGPYDLHVTESVTELCPERSCGRAGSEASSPQVLTDLLGEAVSTWGEVASPQRTGPDFNPRFFAQDPGAPRRFEEFIRSLGTSEQPRFDFVHVLFPHQPFDWLPSGARYEAPGPPRGAPFYTWIDDDAAAAARQRHLLQAKLADIKLGRVIERMRSLGTWDESLVIVTADHGAAFRAGNPMRAVTRENYAEILWAPLFVKAPGQQEGTVDDADVRSVDLVPTIADAVGVEVPWATDGVPAGERTTPAGQLRVKLPSHNGFDLTGYHEFDARRGFASVLAARPLVPAGGDEALRLYRLGPFGDLVGQEVADLELGTSSGLEATLEPPGPERTVAEGRKTVPAYVEGVMSPGPAGRLAVAVNGTIGGVTLLRTSGSDNPSSLRRFWTMVPEVLLEEGSNRIELYLVEGEPGAVRLRPVAL